MRAPSQSSILKLAISADALSPKLATLLALQRAEEPETVILLQEVAAGDLVRGLENGNYDIGMTLATASADPSLTTQLLWGDELALAVPLRSPLLAHAEVSLDVLLHYPLVRWCLQACEALHRQVDAILGPEEHVAQEATSFELMAVLVAAGYGVGVAPRSRILQARRWGVAMRPLANGPYFVRSQLLQSPRGSAPAIARFTERATKVSATEPA
jgi:DNA-binding transcriptional LysR family regulator